MSTYTATIRCLCAPVALALAGLCSTPAVADPGAWTYREFSGGGYRAAEAQLWSRNHDAVLAINCSISGDHTISIQYRPGASIGLSMGPVTLDWNPPRGIPLSSKLVWEPNERGAFARDGVNDRNASDVALEIGSAPGVLSITAGNIEGSPEVTTYDSAENLQAVSRVLAQCPRTPPPRPR